MTHLEEGLRKLILAGVGAVASTAEKSQELLDQLVRKGELTVEQGKVLNEELKHSVKERVKESVTVQVAPEDGEDLLNCVDSMTKAQRDALREKLARMDQEEAPKADDAE